MSEQSQKNGVNYVVHGTYYSHWPRIKIYGLERANRPNITCYGYVPHVTSGPQSFQLHIYINVDSAIADGVKFSNYQNGKVHCAGNRVGVVEPKHFWKVVDLLSGEVIYSSEFGPSINNPELTTQIMQGVTSLHHPLNFSNKGRGCIPKVKNNETQELFQNIWSQVRQNDPENTSDVNEGKTVESSEGGHRTELSVADLFSRASQSTPKPENHVDILSLFSNSHMAAFNPVQNNPSNEQKIDIVSLLANAKNDLEKLEMQNTKPNISQPNNSFVPTQVIRKQNPLKSQKSVPNDQQLAPKLEYTKELSALAPMPQSSEPVPTMVVKRPQPSEVIPILEPSVLIPTPEISELIATPEPLVVLATPEPLEGIGTPEPSSEVLLTPELLSYVLPTPNPTSEVIATPEPSSEVLPTPEPSSEVLPTPEPSSYMLATPEPTSDVLPTPELTSDVLPTPELTSDVLPTPELTSDVLLTPEPTSEAIATPEPSSEVLPTPELSSEVIATPEPSSEMLPTPEPSSEMLPTPEQSSETLPTPELSSEVIATPEPSSEVLPTPEPSSEVIAKPAPSEVIATPQPSELTATPQQATAVPPTQPKELNQKNINSKSANKGKKKRQSRIAAKFNM